MPAAATAFYIKHHPSTDHHRTFAGYTIVNNRTVGEGENHRKNGIRHTLVAAAFTPPAFELTDSSTEQTRVHNSQHWPRFARGEDRLFSLTAPKADNTAKWPSKATRSTLTYC